MLGDVDEKSENRLVVLTIEVKAVWSIFLTKKLKQALICKEG